MCQRIGFPPISTIGLGRTSVSSAKREPQPLPRGLRLSYRFVPFQLVLRVLVQFLLLCRQTEKLPILQVLTNAQDYLDHQPATAVPHRFFWRSHSSELICAGTFQNDGRCRHDNFDVEQQIPLVDVLQIETNHLFKRKFTATSDLPQAGDPRLHPCATFGPLGQRTCSCRRGQDR